MPYLLLASGLLALLTAADALAPRKGALLLIPAFFAAWLTIELAPWVLAAEVVVTALLAAGGGLRAWPGELGLAATVAGWVCLAITMVRARRTTVTVREWSAELELDPEEVAPAFPRSHVVFPVLMTRRAGVTRVRDVAYGDHPAQRLDVYLPADGAAADGGAGARGLRPGVMEVHGGAWLIGSKREQGVPLLNHLAANGWVGINADYRLSPHVTFPEHLIDLKRAIRWYREHAAEYGADPGFLCVTGGSAGGHLAALVALTANVPEYQPGFEDVDTTVRAAVPFYGVYDMRALLDGASRRMARVLEDRVMGVRRADDPEAYAKASPLHWPHAGAPPFLVIHGSLDTLVPVAQARTFTARLREVSHAPVLYAEMKGAEHAFDIFPSYRSARVIEGVERFLTSVWRSARPGTAVAEPSADRRDTA